jgi:D-serine deaminase-like pyridoxal phosphate-dependent protein
MASTTTEPRQRADTRTLSGLEKSIPAAAAGATVSGFLASRPRLSAFSTPLLVLDSAAMDANVARMASWCAARGLGLAPHGKTTMAPALWERQLRAGAWGITVATASQLRVGVAFGVRRLQLANALVDPAALAWLSAALDADPELEVLSWADSTTTVAAMDAALAAVAPARPLTVLVELGAPGGRTGARDRSTARAVADAIGASPFLRLGGVGGYEGALAHDATAPALDVVRSYLEDMAALHTELRGSGAYPGDAVVTAGGSAYFDVVADVLGPLAAPDTHVQLRSGAYMIHDDGFYRGISPLDGPAREDPDHFESAMHGFVTIVSTPEPGLALFDAGKRDLPFDEGLPTPQAIRGRSAAESAEILAGAEVTALNDQHGFLRFPAEKSASLPVGTVLRLGLSHPCTAFDKWRVIPLIDDHTAADPRVVDLISTYF